MVGLRDTFNIVKLDSWKFHAKNPDFTYYIIYLNHLEFLITCSPNSVIVRGDYT